MVTKRPNPKKDKSARRRRPSPPPRGISRGGAGGAVLTAAGLTEGLVLASGVRVRAVRADDVEVAQRLIGLTGSGVNLEHELAAAVTNGKLSAAVMKGLSESPDALTYEMAVAASPQGEGSVEDLVLGLTCVLIAEHPEAGVVGALLVLPPTRALSHIGLPDMEALVGLLKVVKLKAVAVDPAHRSGGIAAALIATCRQLYIQLGYLLLYGQFQTGSGLETYYRRQGLTVLKEGQGVRLTMFSVPAGIYRANGTLLRLRSVGAAADHSGRWSSSLEGLTRIAVLGSTLSATASVGSSAPASPASSSAAWADRWADWMDWPLATAAWNCAA